MEPARLPLDLDGSEWDVLRALRDEPMPFCLVGRWAGGGAVLGAGPARVVRGPEVLAALDATAAVGSSIAAGLVGGGWVGQLAFGLGASLERLPPAPPAPVPGPSAVLGWYEWVVRRDADGAWFVEGLTADAAARGSELVRSRLGDGAGAPRGWRLDGMELHGAGAAGHRAAVADCVDRIAAGDLFQANLCVRLDGTFSGSAADAFCAAADVLSPAYGAFLGQPDGGALLSFSPELFLRRTGRDVVSGPIKGTAPRASDPAALLASAKDAAEHVMIVDLMRNDLGRVAAYGSVAADPAPHVEAHPGLWHLVTDVRARLRDGVGDGHLVRATFPPGSVTGAPKIQALKVISELEGTARAAYTGAIGFVSPLAGLELSVTIRTLEVGAGGRAWMGAGGGIVADSRPEAELREALGKARPVIEALGATVPVVPTAPVMRAAAGLRRLARPDPSLGVLETIAVAGGRALFVEEHLERLAASARALFGVALPADAGDRVVAAGAAAVARPGRPRVRVVLRADGSLEVTVAPRAGAAVPPDMVLEPCVLAGGLGPHKWADRSPMAGFEGLVCDLDGGVLEATSATVWLVEGDELVTPVADGRILPGTVRERVLAAPGLDARAEPIDFPRLSAADGLVVTSSIRIAAPAALAGTGGPTDAARRVAKAIRAAVGEESGVAIEAGEPV